MEHGTAGPDRPRDPSRTRRSRSEQRASTEAAIRRAGLRLLTAHGFHDTTTDDIAREAGVSARTFFNYFANKEAVVTLPRGLLTDNMRQALLARPAGEHPAAALAAAALTTLTALEGPNPALTNPLLRTGIRMASRFPNMRHRAWERRAELEEVAWQALRDRGIDPEDLAARVAVTVVMSLSWQAMITWASSEGSPSLPIVFTRHLLALPRPSIFVDGLRIEKTDTTEPGPNDRRTPSWPS